MAKNGSEERHHSANDNQDNHQGLYHLVYVLGFCVASAIVDFAFLWPENHFAALLALAALLSLPLVYELHIRKTQFAYWRVGPMPCRLVITGPLLPSAVATPATPCGINPWPLIPADALRILMGDSAVIRDVPGKFVALRVAQCDVLAMERTPTGVSVYVSLYDAAGKQIANVDGKQITAISGDNSSVDRGGDLSSLTIRDGAGKEMMYLYYLNPTTISVRGVFGCPGHMPVSVDEGKQIAGFISGFCARDAGVAIDVNSPLSPASATQP